MKTSGCGSDRGCFTGLIPHPARCRTRELKGDAPGIQSLISAGADLFAWASTCGAM
jgi:hypothetical protein